MSINRLRAMVPWWARIGTKVILARLPIPYAFWKRLRLFEHGTMEQPARALSTFLEHARSAGILIPGKTTPSIARIEGQFNVVEIGPGDSLFSAVIARSMGATCTWLVDAGAFATTRVEQYGQLIAFLKREGYPVPVATFPGSVEAVMEQCGGVYLTNGVASFAQLASASVDYCFSNAVLEHIPKSDFELLAAELKRVLKPSGVSVHRVDLKDHLGGGLNNLRFAEETWEAPLLRNSGFYTNRIRFKEMVGLFERAGFACALPRVVRWETQPLPRDKLAASFRRLSDEDLMVSGFDLVLTSGRAHI